MHVPHNAFVVVADGRKMLFLRNEGDAEYPNLQVEKKLVDNNPKDSDQKRDQSGQSSSTQSGTMGETDFAQQAEDRWAADAGEQLRKRALANDFDALVVIAAPKTLGELRKHYHKEVEARLVGELAKEMTDRPVGDIEQMLQGEGAPPS